ncbi:MULTISPECIES: DUF3087 family protein [Vibrio]|nr:DUF3087 family protein [Vibrio splendidus]
MKISNIDKDTYRRKTNLVMVGFAGSLVM